MLVGKGALTFRTYKVAGKHATPSPEAVVEKLASFRFAGLGDGDEGVASGWVAPEHLFDGEFDVAKCFRGHFACFALRIDSKKVPSALLAAHCAMEEKAYLEANDTDKVPGGKRREIKREIKAKLLAETPPTQRTFGVFWRVKSKKLFFQSTSKGSNEELKELFARTFDLELEAQAPSLIAHEMASDGDRLSLLQDATPLRLAAPSAAGKSSKKRTPVTAASE